VSDPKTWRMDAYYYGFTRTGVDAVDLVLSAVACAGKAFHHTESWMDQSRPYNDEHRGETPAEWIQNAASDLAQRHAALEAENARLRAALVDAAMRAESLKRPCDDGPDGWQVKRNLEYMAISDAARAALAAQEPRDAR
jgi:hypothetical protein